MTRPITPKPSITAGRDVFPWTEPLSRAVATQKMAQPPFAFTGKIDRITPSIDRPKLTPADQKLLREKSQRSNAASE